MVMGSRIMSVSVAPVVVTSTFRDEEDEPVVMVVVSVSGVETDVSVSSEEVEVSGRSCACTGRKYEKNMPTRAMVVVNVLVFIEMMEGAKRGTSIYGEYYRNLRIKEIADLRDSIVCLRMSL